MSQESACNVGDLGLIPGWGKSPGESMATHSRIPVWEIPCTEEPGGLQSMGPQRSDTKHLGELTQVKCLEQCLAQ